MTFHQSLLLVASLIPRRRRCAQLSQVCSYEMKQRQPRIMFRFAAKDFSLRKIAAASAALYLVYSVAALKVSSAPDSPAIANDLPPREENDLRWASQLRGGGDDTLNLLAEKENIWLRPNSEHRDASLLGEVSLFHAYFMCNLHRKELLTVIMALIHILV